MAASKYISGATVDRKGGQVVAMPVAWAGKHLHEKRSGEAAAKLLAQAAGSLLHFRPPTASSLGGTSRINIWLARCQPELTGRDA